MFIFLYNNTVNRGTRQARVDKCKSRKQIGLSITYEAISGDADKNGRVKIFTMALCGITVRTPERWKSFRKNMFEKHYSYGKRVQE